MRGRFLSTHTNTYTCEYTHLYICTYACVPLCTCILVNIHTPVHLYNTCTYTPVHCYHGQPALFWVSVVKYLLPNVSSQAQTRSVSFIFDGDLLVCGISNRKQMDTYRLGNLIHSTRVLQQVLLHASDDQMRTTGSKLKCVEETDTRRGVVSVQVL